MLRHQLIHVKRVDLKVGIILVLQLLFKYNAKTL
jgi:hypothetical protein